MLLYVYSYLFGILLLFLILFLWIIKFQRQNINHSETGTGDKLTLELHAYSRIPGIYGDGDTKSWRWQFLFKMWRWKWTWQVCCGCNDRMADWWEYPQKTWATFSTSFLLSQFLSRNPFLRKYLPVASKIIAKLVSKPNSKLIPELNSKHPNLHFQTSSSL